MLNENILSLIALLFPWAIFIANLRLFHGKRRLIAVLASLVLTYATIILQVHLIDTRLENELNAFDLNGDGIFSDAEITPAQQAAMAALTNDAGRAMAPITGAIFSVLYVAACLIIWSSASWVWSKYRARRI